MGVDLISAAAAGTMYGLLQARTERAPDAPAYQQFDKATGAWSSVTWREVLARVDKVAGAMATLGLAKGDRVAIFLGNCLDWVCYDMAAHKLGLPVVPLYTNDAVSSTAYVLSDARPRLVLMDNAARWQKIRDAMERSDFIDTVWIHDPASDDTLPAPAVAFSDALELASGVDTQEQSGPEDVAALIYTSGTTGAPKGAMLTHRALLANAEGVAAVFPPVTDDVFLSILPLAHGFERTMGYVLPMLGGACVAYAPSLLRLRQDMATLRPTVIMAVPRFYESIYSAARRSASESTVRLRLFEMTGRIGWQRFASRAGVGPGPSLGERLIWPLLDRLVARKVQDAFGGRLRVAVSGGATFPPEIARDLIGLGIPMVEGYGLTEAGPVVTASLQKDYVPGSVGFALPGIEVRLTDKGEIRVRSPAAMKGYWQNQEATEAMIDPEGWLRTGDLGAIEGGRISVTGRLKHILVLSNGENVNPRPIETELEADPLFDQVCVAGDGRPYLSVLLVLKGEIWAELAASHGLDPERPNAPEAEKVLLPRIKAHLKDYPSHQQIRAYHAMLEEWTVEQRLVTPTLKLRRERIVAAFAEQIAALYARDRG
ncbi:AMP-dependent synthetase/ligase [Tropicimonas aquimaris]|uniref:AMP-dependent synthetase/ligase n=1 Tax=Tropicimonas aquimaris TaxID=914152 RepID=A0ABW3IPD1_9RHOB